MIIVWFLLESKVPYVMAKLSELLGMAFEKLFESCLLLEIPDLARLLILALTRDSHPRQVASIQEVA